MARLTVTFKGRTIRHLPLDTGTTGIGREADNALQIDSLAVAPHHAIVDAETRGMVLKQLNEDFPLLVNGRKVKEHILKDGDCITLGKHDVYFMDEDPKSRAEATKPKAPTGSSPTSSSSSPMDGSAIPDAGLQLLNGKQIGLVIPLRNPLTRLDRDESSSAVIARRVDGFFLASLSNQIGEATISVNGECIGDRSIRLNDGDLIKINQHKLRFFLG